MQMFVHAHDIVLQKDDAKLQENTADSKALLQRVKRMGADPRIYDLLSILSLYGGLHSVSIAVLLYRSSLQ